MSEITPGGRLNDEQLVDWLRLIRSENIGPRTFRQLINRYGGARAALEALPELVAENLRGRVIRLADRDEVLREIVAAQAKGVRFLASIDPDYPPLLREIADAPPILAVRGDASVSRRDAVAIVGSRNASAVGLAFAERLARGLSGANYVIVSGLARGIDAVAHRATLTTGTIAVLAGGHARPYPSEHEKLADDIAERGLVISEMPFDWEPRGRDFPRRNRLIAGVSRATVVVEAARRSGSLITAKFANDQGREVFAVPGSPLDPRAEGANDLLRQGATMCTRAEDVIELLAGSSRNSSRTDLFDTDEGADELEPLFDEIDFFAAPPATFVHGIKTCSTYAKTEVNDFSSDHHSQTLPTDERDPSGLIISLLGPAPITVNELVRVSGLSAQVVHGALVELEVCGRILRPGLDLVSLVYNQ
jgi:DNA processing protein